MRTLWLSLGLALLCLPFGGCLLPTTSGGSDAGSGGSKVDVGATIITGTPTGTGCGTDPTTGVTLCTGTTECPGVTFNPSVFPGCGFYISGLSLDLECLCADYLCPVGAATTCTEAAALLQASNEGTVCAEISSNGCSQIPVGGTGGTAGTGGSGGSAGSGPSDAGAGCDKTCESMCAGEPDCIQLCGC
jgi:hypothetical protein